MKTLLFFAAAFFMINTANAQWIVQNAGYTNDTLGFYEMSLPDKNTVWAVSYDGRRGLLGGRPVLDFTRTTDGGNTWIPGKVGNDITLRFSNISAIDGQEAWVAMHKMDYSTRPKLGYVGFGKGGGIFHTTDAGVSWEHTEPGVLFDENSTPQFVYFKDRNHGIAVGNPNQGYWEIYLTNNKGKKWKRVSAEKIPAPLENERGWISGYAAVKDTVWFGTTAGRMYKSTDFGHTWMVHTVTNLPTTEVNEIAFLDDGKTGIAHLRNNNIFRTYVFSTTDGGLTWTNYFQPSNWKNSRVTAVPGTNAFISTSTHPNPLFTGSSISYDAGQTWTHIDQTAQKAVCRFYDAETGYAGGFFLTGPPLRGGIFKSQIIFDIPPSPATTITKAESEFSRPVDALVKIYPTPANNVINVLLQDEMVNANNTISIFSLDGRIIQSNTSSGSRQVQFDVSKLTSGVYMIRIESKNKSIHKMFSIAR